MQLLFIKQIFSSNEPFILFLLCRLPYSLVIRVWDLYLLEGEPIMFAMAYTILKLHRYVSSFRIRAENQHSFVADPDPAIFSQIRIQLKILSKNNLMKSFL